MATIITKIRRGLKKNFEDWAFFGHGDNDESIFYLAFTATVDLSGSTCIHTKGWYINLRFTSRAKTKRISMLHIDTGEEIVYEVGDMEVSQQGDSIILVTTVKGMEDPTKIIFKDIVEKEL